MHSRRQPILSTVPLGTSTVRPEVARAITHLSDVTGLSKAHVIRLAVDGYMTELGLVTPVELEPTLPAGPHRPKKKGQDQ